MRECGFIFLSAFRRVCARFGAFTRFAGRIEEAEIVFDLDGILQEVMEKTERQRGSLIVIGGRWQKFCVRKVSEGWGSQPRLAATGCNWLQLAVERSAFLACAAMTALDRGGITRRLTKPFSFPAPTLAGRVEMDRMD